MLNEVSPHAQSVQRLRMNFNLHASLDAHAQRLLNAVEQSTVVPIHRHTHRSKMHILLRGSINVMPYNKITKKELQETYSLNPIAGNLGIHISENQWHTIEVLKTGTVLFLK